MASLKLITIGEAGVGKTALTMRYANNSYGCHDMTIGVDFATKRLSDGGRVQIWDTAGQESFRSISRSYYRGADAALVVFALNNARSFNKIKQWIQDFRNVNSDGLLVLVGTKSDLPCEVLDVDIDTLKNELELEYFECSAKQNKNVCSPFEYVYNTLKHAKLEETKNIKVVPTQGKHFENCC